MTDTPFHAAVFGATSAIARETLRALVAERPAHLLLLGRNRDRLEAVADDLRARGASCETRVVDLLDPDADWEGLLAGKLWDLLYLAHGSLPDQEATLADPHAIGRELDVNLISPIRIASACARVLERQGRGTLAVIGSVAGARGRASNFLYGSAKAGLETFLEGLQHRLAGRRDIHVVLLKPGMTDTPMTADFEKGALFSPAEKVGAGAWNAIRRGRQRAYLPGWWRGVMTAIRLTPSFVLHRTKL